jgi:pSer/pThr/pTyr-binding forkhead associated (FHA) protein
MPNHPAAAAFGGMPRAATGGELQAVLRAERDGAAFLIARAPGAGLLILKVPPEARSVTIGRSAAADLSIGWDSQVSTLHAEVEQLAGELMLVDDGLSRNGSYVNGARIRGRHRLRDGDVLRFGASLVQVRVPGDARRTETSVGADVRIVPALSAQQRNVLSALCRPALAGEPLAAPATNQQIADELCLSVAAVKLHLRALFEKFQIGGLPQNRKRLALVRLALITSTVPPVAQHEGHQNLPLGWLGVRGEKPDDRP